MSAGPIQKWRDGARVPDASTNPTTAAHALGNGVTAYCGRRRVAMVSEWRDVTCADCLAAARADGLIS